LKIFRESNRGCSKRCAQQGRRDFGARSVLIVREHDKGPRTPLTPFFNIPLNFTEEVFEQGMIGSNPFDILNRFPSTGVTILKGLIVLLLSQEWEDGF